MIGPHPPSRAHIKSRRVDLERCGWFWAWALVGGAAALSVVSFVGVLVFPPVLLVGALMASRETIRRSAFGLLSGAGILLLYVAWLQRVGPGTTCWHTASASGCDRYLHPLPWAIAGLLFFVGGIVGHARRGRDENERGRPEHL